MKSRTYLYFLADKITALFIILLFFSCEELPNIIDEPLTSEFPETPELVSIDLDEDGVLDYEVIFHHLLIESTETDAGLVGVFNTLGENETLVNDNQSALFLRNLDEIQEAVQNPLAWENDDFGLEIVYIQNNIEDLWPLKWEVRSDSEESSYFLGLKLIKDAENQLGWIEVTIDDSTGQVQVIDQGLL